MIQYDMTAQVATAEITNIKTGEQKLHTFDVTII